MQYNTQKEKLTLSGYGRIVQDMVQHAMSIEDRDERNRCAATIVRVMATLTGQQAQNEETRQKLWDHLAEISGYQLDVDYPVAITPHEERTSRPQPLPYPTNKIRNRQYGTHIEKAIARLAEMPESPLREHLTEQVANQMKRLLSSDTKDERHEERIHDELIRFTNGAVSLPKGFRFANPNAKCVQGSNSLVGHKKKKKK